MATQTDDPALARLAALDFSRSATPAPKNGEPNPDPFPDRERWPLGLPWLADIGAALHQTTGLEVVADSFVRARLGARSAAVLQANPRPVAQILDQVANELDYSWRKEGNLLFFRSRRYYQDRIEEVPERILRPWRQRVRRAGAATLDDLADLAAALNDSQVRGLQRYWGWYFAETPALPPSVDRGGFYASRQHLRFWASLTPWQRQAARSGAILPVARMSPRQTQAFAAALDSRGQMGELCRPARREEIATGGFGYQGEPPGGPLDHTFMYYLGGELTPARTVSLQVSRGDRP